VTRHAVTSRRCRWCNGSGVFIRSAALRVNAAGQIVLDGKPCRHPGPATVYALGDFRTTKYRVAKPKPGQRAKPLKPATPTWRAPKPVARMSDSERSS
jgi:hypothetical protein